MQIERIEYKRNKVEEKVVPFKKEVLTKIDDSAYLLNVYHWDVDNKEWYASYNTSYFDGEKLVDTGSVRSRTGSDVDRYFELLVEYEKFRYVKENWYIGGYVKWH